MRHLVVGWGNPIAGDDGVGWRAAELVRARGRDAADPEVIVSSRGGIQLAERLLGYDRAIILDASVGSPVGAVTRREFTAPAEDRPAQGRCGHDGTLPAALEALCRLGADTLPRRVVLLTLCVPPPERWCSRVSPSAEAGAVRLARAAWEELKEGRNV